MQPTDCCFFSISFVDDNVLPFMTASGHLLMAFSIRFIRHVAKIEIPKLGSWTLLDFSALK